jgi:lipopolysaccharide/colanic/teichoic acid biosynthesis glycosyltransferase/GT2 family glycosyltransferase
MTRILASVIVPAKDVVDIIPACIDSLKNQEGYRFNDHYEIILVDDGSTDHTADIAEASGIIVIRQINKGPAAARNNGVENAKGEIVLFTDSDCIPASNWLYQMLKPFNDKAVMGVKGAYYSHEKNPVARFVQQEFEYKYRLMALRDKIDFIDTYSAAYRKDLFLENHGFEEAFPVPSVEDQELSFRLARKGYKLVFAPDARVYHRHDLSILEYFRRKYGIGFWKAFMLRWLPEKTLTDTYTPASQRWQILLLAASLIFLGSGLVWHWMWWFFAGSMLFFMASALDFFKLIIRNDKNILLISLPLTFIRAGALGSGLAFGFLFPSKAKKPARQGLNIYERLCKRLVDIFGAITGIILGSPVMLIAMLVIQLESRGKSIFIQERIGEYGNPFNMYKLRTMFADDEEKADNADVLTRDYINGVKIKNPNDPRVTRVGRFLRRWSIDEIPQFWNILKGEMSLVGPRPEESGIVAMYNDHHRKRLAVKPGLTGLMQIAGRGNLNMEERLALELDYINNFSIWRDFEIVLKTIAIVISGKGAY